MNKSTKTILVASGVAAAIGVGAVAAYSEAMFSLFSRKKSLIYNEMRRNQAKKFINSPQAEAVAAARESLQNAPTQAVEIASFDGLRLAGRWYPAENPVRTVVCMHGWRGSYFYDFGTVYQFLRDSGCNLLFADQRCHGGSEGKYISYGILERYDVQAWVDWAAKKSTCPIYLFGMSMGAATVLMASDLELKEQIRGIVADCGYTTPDAIIKSTLARDKRFPVEPTLKATDRICRRRAGYSYEDFSTLDAMSHCTVPVLFIHGSSDKFVPCAMTIENYETCTAPKELLIVPGAGHCMSYTVATEMYQNAVTGFFAKYDPKN